MRIKTVIFDLYGTLIDLNHHLFLQQISQILDVPVVTFSTKILKSLMITRFRNDQEMLEFLCHKLRIENVTLEQIDELKSCLSCHLESAVIAQGSYEVLSFLKSRGVKIGLISNLAQPYIKPFNRFGLSQYFDAVLFSCEFGKLKPNPDVYLSICKQLSVKPEECVFIGDSIKSDFKAPKSLGMQAIYVGSVPVSPRASNISELINTSLWDTLDSTPDC